ncbi:hypothetical protein MDA_GLEAN10013414 [Myotis davidii]|uniref:Uncharacterized protein n=1 Tax=Myotis davidii TaxID=225400 RepID=L5LZJ1_MYODS|nr:hypothetical protein MDA_GLEAN10013414 [Myotis davidii]
MASKEVWKIQREEKCNTSLEKTGSNLQQRMRAVQEEKVKVNYGRQGNVTSVVMSQKTVMEGISSGKGSKAGASLMDTVSRPAITD